MSDITGLDSLLNYYMSNISSTSDNSKIYNTNGVKDLSSSSSTEKTNSSFQDKLQSEILVSLFTEMMKDSADFKNIMYSVIKAYSINGTLDLSQTSSAASSYSTIKASDVSPEKVTSSGNLTIDEAISKAAKKYSVDPAFIKAVIKTESDFNPNAVSSANCVGLMQLSPNSEVYKELSNPFDIQQNIDAGTKKLGILLDMYGKNKELALAAYNAGAGTVSRTQAASTGDFSKLPKETQNYIPKVMKYYNEYK